MKTQRIREKFEYNNKTYTRLSFERDIHLFEVLDENRILAYEIHKVRKIAVYGLSNINGVITHREILGNESDSNIKLNFWKFKDLFLATKKYEELIK